MKIVPILSQYVHRVQRQPAADEDGNHGDEHGVGATLTSDILRRSIFALRHYLLTLQRPHTQLRADLKHVT